MGKGFVNHFLFFAAHFSAAFFHFVRDRIGLDDTVLEDDFVVWAVSQNWDGVIVGDDESLVQVSTPHQGPDVVARFGVLEVHTKTVGDERPEQFSGAHSEGGGESGDLHGLFDSVVREDSDGQGDGDTVLVIERAHVDADLDGERGGRFGFFRSTLEADVVDERLIRSRYDRVERGMCPWGERRQDRDGRRDVRRSTDG